MAKLYIDGSLSRLNHHSDNYISFVNGNPGIHSIASVIYDTMGLKSEAAEYIERVKDVF